MAWRITSLLVLAALAGFAAHRASLCTVRAVLEIVHARTAHMLASFLKTALWAALIFGLVVWSAPGTGMLAVLEPRPFAIAGGFLFGLGAACNGACAYSTLQRVADGDLWGLTTLAGMAAGVLGWAALDAALLMTHPATVPIAWTRLGAWAPSLIALLAVLGLLEATRLWRLHPGARLGPRVLASHYRVASAALVMGICAGLLYALQGGWSYTTTLRRAIESGYRGTAGPTLVQFALFAAFFGGMLLSSLQRRSFHAHWRPSGSVWPRLAGGMLMGAGAAMVPGGNDTLILTGLPAFSGWALAAYVAVLAGVAAGLALLRQFGFPLPVVTCEDGVCRERFV
ncbi:MAG TPA: YeeE/YedE thiosulfate transporter family protein [Burkholderiaceae bacterium]|nr:YeeE/YedE thiosulfate transporter family protein [Burkholderiaceae bacterium]